MTESEREAQRALAELDQALAEHHRPWWLYPLAAVGAILVLSSTLTALDWVLAIFLWILHLFS